ncbi:hypothetical protein TgHK011_009771 [Trichoderma gracile]|nr:hypothetical protein TgHK011_009771 [Trichoderma gracile]
MEAERGDSKIVKYVFRSLTEEEDFHFLRLEFLHRLNIVQLQLDLVQLKRRFQQTNVSSPESLKELRVGLKHYATAIRDYQFLRNMKSVEKASITHRKLLLQKYFDAELDLDDPFEAHYAYCHDVNANIDPIRESLLKYIPDNLAFSRPKGLEKYVGDLPEGKPPRSVSPFVDRLARFIISFIGPVFLVAPMIIMTLNPSQTKSLVTVSVAVIIFSLLLSFGVRVSNVDTLVSTATYAAVLVVFVGTSTGGGTS